MLTGDRTIIAVGTANPNLLNPYKLAWSANGTYVDTIKLGSDLYVGEAGYPPQSWFNSSGTASKMVLDLAGYDVDHVPWRFSFPAMTVTDSVGGSTLNLDGIEVEDSTFTVDSGITIKLRSDLVIDGATLPNLTIIPGNGTNIWDTVGGGTISGDLTLNAKFAANVGRITIGGDVNVNGSDPNAGLDSVGGVTTGFNLQGDLIDTNTENDNGAGGLLRYTIGKLYFNGTPTQTIDLRRESGMRLKLESGSEVKLQSDYYAPYVGVEYHGSTMAEATLLDVAAKELTLTDLGAYWNGADDDSPVFKYTAGADSGLITILGDTTNDPTGTGLRLNKFKVVIVDGGDWVGGDDFILFDYDGQGSSTILTPTLINAALPSGWTHSGLVHDTTGKQIYLDDLDYDSDGDGVADTVDECPNTPPGTQVNSVGCPDEDGDGVMDACDLCPDTCPGATVDSDGCPTTWEFCQELTGVTASGWGDYNNDGYPDMFGGNNLWTNDGDGTFTKTTPFSNLAYVSLGDWNNDGYLDVFCMLSPNWPTLWTNDGDETWTDDSDLFADGDVPSNCFGSTWGDFNGDGYLDTYSAGWYTGTSSDNDVIYMSNDGLGWQHTWSAPTAHGKGVTVCDFDEDSELDIYVSNYWLDFGFLWRNDAFDGNSGLTDVHASYGVNDGPGHTQGSTWGDFDNDGDFDLFICNFAHPQNPDSRFMENHGGSPDYKFTNIGLCGVTQIEPIAGSTTGDYNNDGYLDLLITTSLGYAPPNTIMLYSNDGDFTFTNVTSSVGLGSLGPDDVAAWGDYNEDGHLDVIVADALYRNPGNTGNHWLKVKLIGGEHSSGLVNGAAIGAQVRINTYTSIGTVTRQVPGNTGLLGMQNDQVLHFGLGSDPCDTYDLEIDWPNGYSETIEDVNIDEYIEIEMLNLPACNFTAASQSDSESCGTMTITAQLSETSDENVTIPFSLGGTATEGAGADYTITSSPITITTGNTTANITITVNDDPCSESAETVIVTMGTLIGANKISPSVHTATITDNDEDCGDTMHIEAAVCVEISCGTQSRKNGRATITIYDDCGDPVENALVDGTFSGDFDESYDDVSTDENGQAVFTTTGCVKQPSWSFTVDDVTGSLTYDSDDDLTTGCSE